MRYGGTIIRPFSEADSYLLQCTLGCSHNQCTFCGTYKDKPFRIRPLREIKEDIQMARQSLGEVRKGVNAPRMLLAGRNLVDEVIQSRDPRRLRSDNQRGL